MFKAKIHGRDYAIKTDRLGGELAGRISKQMDGYWARRELRIAELQRQVGQKLGRQARGKIAKRGKRRPVVVVGLFSPKGGYRVFPSISEAASSIGTKTSNICSAMRNGGTVRSRIVVYLEEIEDRGFHEGDQFIPFQAPAGCGVQQPTTRLEAGGILCLCPPTRTRQPLCEASNQPRGRWHEEKGSRSQT